MLVIGGGLVGIELAAELAQKYTGSITFNKLRSITVQASRLLWFMAEKH